MPEIIPAIIAKDFLELEKKIKLIESYVNWVQLDVSDGKFTTMKTWNSPGELKQIDTKLNLEVHLMIFEPEKEIDKWINSGVKRILIHYESTEQLPDLIEKIKNIGLEVGVVLNLQTPIEVVDELLAGPFDSASPTAMLRSGNNNDLLPEQGDEVAASKAIDVIQLMGISEIGYYGHPFSDRVIPKIFSLKAKYSNVKIAVDGGINSETVQKAAQAGADILVAGSAIFESGDARKAIEELKQSI